MTTAVKMSEAPPASRPRTLAVDSLLGVGMVVACLAIAMHGLPYLWWHVIKLPDNAQNSVALLIAIVAFLVASFLAGRRWAGEQAPEGLAAGVFTLFVSLFGSLLLAVWLGTLLKYSVKDLDPNVGLGVMGGTFAALVFFALRFSRTPRFQQAMETFEGQGWFTKAPFKRNQGMRVRRATMFGVLLIVGCGIFTLEAHRTLYKYVNWELVIPFTNNVSILLLPHVKFTVPLLLAAGALWLGYRLVNVPVFADFLIATEAELNKVSWTTRKRLVQDTIVVLVTVFLMTVFLFFVDQLWAFTLSRIGVVQLPESKQDGQKEKELPY